MEQARTIDRAGDVRAGRARGSALARTADSRVPGRAVGTDPQLRLAAAPARQGAGLGASAAPIQLRVDQIEAANRIHDRLVMWRAGRKAAATLATRVPGFAGEAVLLKVITTRSLFGGSVFSLAPMVRHVERVMGSTDVGQVGPELVERLAAVGQPTARSRGRREYGFASKFAHAFVDPDRFPVMDPNAIRMLGMHLGARNRSVEEDNRYVEFVMNFRRLRALAGFSGPRRHLDRYLWVAGQVHEWRNRPKARINPELAALLSDPTPDAANDFDVLTSSVESGSVWL
ncbi:MAG: hypothetical protein H6811_04020 [Phycisphaeraceae bacterium]|nr:hypothetical protein [Phycisphaeraceae bacterium]